MGALAVRGPGEPFGSAAGYRAAVDDLLATGTMLDAGMLSFDARLSVDHPTVEVRVGDVCLDAGDAVLVAGLARALVETAAREWRAGEAPLPARVEGLRVRSWRAGRSGLSGDLVHPLEGTPAPAEEVVEVLLDHVHEALEDAGDLEEVGERLEALRRRGTGAVEQRAAHARTGDVADVVRHVVARTAPAAVR